MITCFQATCAATSWRGFAPITRLSYPINMLHFRLIMEIAFGDRTRTALAALATGAGAGSSGVAFLLDSLAGVAAVGVLWAAGRGLHSLVRFSAQPEP
jgi:hypothetical protein